MNELMKKLVALSCSLLTLGLFACSSSDDAAKDSSSSMGGDTSASGGSSSGGSASASGGGGTGGDSSGSGGNGPGVGEVSSDCDLSGTWAVVAKTKTSAAGAEQVATRWYLYEITQEAAAVTVSSSLNCAVDVRGGSGVAAAHVTISDATLEGILKHNSHAGLKGKYTKVGDICELDMDRVYNVRGANTETYLPADPSTRPALSDLPALPTSEDSTGAEDWDGDGKLGVLFSIDALFDGQRSSAQRDYIEWDSDSSNPDYTIQLNATTFTVNNTTEIQESVLSSAGLGADIVASKSGTDHPVTFTRLGDTRATSKLPGDLDIPSDDVEACRALEAAFPNN